MTNTCAKQYETQIIPPHHHRPAHHNFMLQWMPRTNQPKRKSHKHDYRKYISRWLGNNYWSPRIRILFILRQPNRKKLLLTKIWRPTLTLWNMVYIYLWWHKPLFFLRNTRLTWLFFDLLYLYFFTKWHSSHTLLQWYRNHWFSKNIITFYS